MKPRTLIRDAGVAEEDEIDVAASGELDDERVEIPTDSGQGFVKRPDVDPDAKTPRLAAQRAERATEARSSDAPQRSRDDADDAEVRHGDGGLSPQGSELSERGTRH